MVTPTLSVIIPTLNEEAVLGPAIDGGYWLVGMRAPGLASGQPCGCSRP